VKRALLAAIAALAWLAVSFTAGAATLIWLGPGHDARILAVSNFLSLWLVPGSVRAGHDAAVELHARRKGVSDGRA
jgi:hypothetical protein